MEPMAISDYTFPIPNEPRTLHVLRCWGPLPLVELARISNIPRQLLPNILDKLTRQGAVEAVEDAGVVRYRVRS